MYHLEFTDLAHQFKSGCIFLVAEDPQPYIAEFGLLEKSALGKKRYYTTLEKMGAMGWELAFVTPCGSFCNPNYSTIQNAYVFRKEIEE